MKNGWIDPNKRKPRNFKTVLLLIQDLYMNNEIVMAYYVTQKYGPYGKIRSRGWRQRGIDDETTTNFMRLRIVGWQNCPSKIAE